MVVPSLHRRCSETQDLERSFGLAGALQETGLPQTDIPLALLMFNVGVETGQLLFVAGIAIAMRASARLFSFPVAPARFAAAYLIGTISMIWFVSRVSGFGA